MSRARSTRTWIRPLLVTTLMGLGLAGCRIRSGPTVEDFEPALTPRGVTATVRTAERVVIGELLVVGDTSLILLLAPRNAPPVIAEVGLSAIRVAELSRLRAGIVRGAYVPEDGRGRVRASSRYPQGLTPDQLALLLAARGQERVERIP